jgi:hypothetical protein
LVQKRTASLRDNDLNHVAASAQLVRQIYAYALNSPATEIEQKERDMPTRVQRRDSLTSAISNQ